MCSIYIYDGRYREAREALYNQSAIEMMVDPSVDIQKAADRDKVIEMCEITDSVNTDLILALLISEIDPNGAKEMFKRGYKYYHGRMKDVYFIPRASLLTDVFLNGIGGPVDVNKAIKMLESDAEQYKGMANQQISHQAAQRLASLREIN